MPVFVKGENPAISLFNFWSQFCGEKQSLENTRRQKVAEWSGYGYITDYLDRTIMPWGSHNYGIAQFLSHDATQSGFIFGRIYRYRRYYDEPDLNIDARFILLSDGRFAFGNQYGIPQRHAISRSTFLSIQVSASRYRWMVDPTLDWTSHEEWEVDLKPSVSMQTTQIGGKLASLWELQQVGDEWEIVLAANQTTAWPMDHRRSVNFDLIRDRLMREDRARRRRVQRRYELNNPPVPSAGFFENPNNIDQIVALLQVDEPVRNTPHIRARRLLEASHE